MKKIFALLLSAMLLLSCLPALGEEESLPLTAEEIASVCEGLLSEALERAPLAAEKQDDGLWHLDYGDFVLYTPDETLTGASPVAAAELTYRPDARGISAGSSLDALLAAYPLDNALLTGAYDEVTLYISGLLPETVSAGCAVRTGSRVLVLEHLVYAAEGDEATLSSVVYTLEGNTVVAVLWQPAVAVMSLPEAQSEIDRLAALQEENEYSMYRSDAPDAMAREDLTFGSIDFVSAGVQEVTAFLGEAQSDTWAQDGENWLRVMQWEGAQAIFQYDAARKNATLQLVQVTGDLLEGPRGVRVDDTLESVAARFPQEGDGIVLYGDGENAPYGRIDFSETGVYLVYAAAVEDGTVLLALTFVGDRLADITCTWL
ncbi:MAG: hypothetical protein IJS53_00390 [Clostridia bacterium]|nr:hypothetical protein [Clostridia bacterium]